MSDHFRQPQASSSSNSNYDPRAEPPRRTSTLGGPSTRGFWALQSEIVLQWPSTAPNTLDWMYGVVVFLLLYWLGIYEKYTIYNAAWMFEKDYLALVWTIVSSLWQLAVGGADPNRYAWLIAGHLEFSRTNTEP
ncbi:hypothetical protein BJ912DRAFT_920590 [Pholiota molesta]|nr:hypothetical protein BJ912DRAFT_920590 [Pholiota molesta]